MGFFYKFYYLKLEKLVYIRIVFNIEKYRRNINVSIGRCVIYW